MPWPLEVPRGRRVVSDIESNGLLKGMSSRDNSIPPMDRIHSATVEDIDTGEHFDWNPDNIHLYPEWLMDEVGTVIGHNFLTFDLRAIKFIFPKFDPKKFLCLDTLIICKMIWPADALIGPDMKRFNAGTMPGKYIKRQSLGAWGYRLGNYKGEYDGGWEKWSPEMHSYMIQDGKVNVDLWRLCERRLGWDARTVSPALIEAGPTPDPEAKPSLLLPQGLSTPSVSSENSPQPKTEGGPRDYVWPYLPIWIEHEMQQIVTTLEERGVAFDREAAEKLIHELKNKQAVASIKLERLFGSWWEPLDNPEKGRRNTRDRTRVCKEHAPITVKRFSEKTGAELKPYVGPPKEYRYEGSTECRIRWTTFNPSSRDHLGDRLQKLFGWKPQQYTANGKPQVDEGAIKAIPSDIITDANRKLIMEYFVVTKVLGMIEGGNKSWMQYLTPEDRIHGRIDPLGTVTGRAAHFNPNLGQVMSVEVDEVKDASGKIISKTPIKGLTGGYGYEARSLFTASYPDFPELTGTDKSSLEFILLGHYLTPYDDGAFSQRVCDPARDPHAEHGELADLKRRDAKTMGYLYIYGGGALKAGKAVGVEEMEIAQLLTDRGLPGRLRFMRKVQGEHYAEPTTLEKAQIVKGAAVKKKFETAIVGLKDLMGSVKEVASDRGYVLNIDGRKLHVRKPHAALNTLLQGGGASACKLWIILFVKRMAEEGYILGVHYWIVLWVHDEKQVEHHEGLHPAIARISDAASKEAGRMLGLRGEFRTESKKGHNWAETH